MILNVVEILQIPVLADNYVYVLVDHDTQCAAVVDPGAGPPVLKVLNERGLTLSSILSTHHHWDHIGGNGFLADKFPNLRVYAGELDATRIDRSTDIVKDGEVIPMLGSDVQIFFVPGHTSGHIAYYFEKEEALFCGDVLFSMGCGRVFDGTVEQLFSSLAKLALLPDDTRIFCGHEYTLHNLHFALSIQGSHDGLRQKLAEVTVTLADGKFSVPSTLGEEKRLNPFMRLKDPDLKRALDLTDAEPLDIFRELRWRKDQFR